MADRGKSMMYYFILRDNQIRAIFADKIEAQHFVREGEVLIQAPLTMKVEAIDFGMYRITYDEEE
jgi:hypothetical protein